MLLFLIVVKSFTQPVNPVFNKDYYLKKSKYQKKTGWILLGLAPVFTSLGALQKDSVDVLFAGNVKNNDNKAYYVLGALSALASIPFFVSSLKNKRKAASAKVSFYNQKMSVSQRTGIVLITHPTLVLTIRF